MRRRDAAADRAGSGHSPAAGQTPALDAVADRAGAFVAMAFLAACLAIAFGPHVIGDYFAETDFYGDYARGAALIQSGKLIPSRYTVVGPTYELALAMAGRVVPNLFVAAQLLSALSATATLLLWFFLLRRRLGSWIASGATLLLAANPTFLRYGYSATTDQFAIALQALALFLLLGRRGNGVALAAGLAAALAFLTRYTAVYLAPVALLAIALDSSFRGRRLSAALLFGAGFALPVAAWWVFAALHGGTPGSQLHHMIAYEAFARSRGIIWDDYQRDLQPLFHNLGDVIRHDPAGLFAHLARNLWEHARLDARSLLGIPVAIAVVIGAIAGWRRGALRTAWPVFLAGGGAYLTLVPAPHGERYSMMLLPAYATLAGLALGPAPWRGTARLGLLLVGVPAVASIIASARLQADALSHLPREVLVCARVLRERARAGDRVLARKPHIAYTSGVESVALPFSGALGDLGAHARRTGTRWLYISHPETGSRPDLYPLLDTTGVIRGLTPRCVTARDPAVLYEIGPEFGPDAQWVADPLLMNLRIARARLLMAPGDVQAMWLEAAMEVRLGQWTRARETLERAAAVDPRSREARDAVAAGDSAAALGALDRLLATLQR